MHEHIMDGCRMHEHIMDGAKIGQCWPMAQH